MCHVCACMTKHVFKISDMPGLLQFYEYGVEDYPSPSQAVRYEREPLGLQPAHEIISLSDYRRRHALYRMDRGLQVSKPDLACVPIFSMCCIWWHIHGWEQYFCDCIASRVVGFCILQFV